MGKLREQGTIADLPMKVSRKVYFVRSENDALADHGWITVDEARRKNSADRREFGTFQNKYFIDQPSADNYMQTVQRGAVGFEEEPPMVPEGPPPGPEGELGPGLEAPEGPPAELPPGLEEPLGDLGGPPEEDDLGDILPGEIEPEPLAPEEEEEEIEFIVPRRVRLRTEARATPTPPWQRHPKSSENHTEVRYCPRCRSEQTFVEDVCQHCHTYLAKPQERRESLAEQGRQKTRRTVTMKCPDCGETWPAKLLYDTGKWWFEDDDRAYCPECGEKGGQVEEPSRAALRHDWGGREYGAQESQAETTEAGVIEALIYGELSASEAIEMLTEQDWQRPGLQPGGVGGEVYVVDHFKGDIAGPYPSEEEALRANEPLGNQELRTDVTDLLDGGYKLLSPYADEETCPPLGRVENETPPSFAEMVEAGLEEPSGGKHA